MNVNDITNMNDSDNSHGDGDVTLPLGVAEGADTSFDPLASNESRKRSMGGSLVIALVVVGAVAGLYSMRMLSRLTAAAIFDTDAESTIDAFLGSNVADGGGGTTFGNGTGVLEVLQDDYIDQQVPIESVRRNPFEIFQSVPNEDPVDTGPVVPMGSTPEELDVRMRSDIQIASTRLELKSVLGGSKPLAIINGEIVQIGDILSVSGVPFSFEVTRIMPAAVELEVRHADLIGTAELVNLIVRR